MTGTTVEVDAVARLIQISGLSGWYNTAQKYQKSAVNPATRPLSAGACDCHAHVFEPDRFPYAAKRSYTPGRATVGELERMHSSLAIERVVLVQPSVYGTDNTCLVDALRAFGPRRARGIAVVNPAVVTSKELAALQEAGVRGIRLNLQVQGADLDAARAQIARARQLLAAMGWSLQLHASLDTVVALLDDLRRLEKPVVLDHYAGGLRPDPVAEELLRRLVVAMTNSPLYVKLSAPYRLWTGAPAASPAALAAVFAQAAPDRILWGSDWPHTGNSRRGLSIDAIEPFRDIDNAQVLQQLLAAIPDPQVREALLVRNPQTLYGFDA